ncbi:NAD(P)H-dependent oxidoreductase [Bacillus sp. NP157]|nr:NAD(P)H-dependent oxidoreductase [Bacillus sp. NP157]
MALKALGLNCTLSRSPKPSSTQKMLDQILQALATHGVEGDSQRVVDLDIKPGVSHDEGDGDEWPALRQRVMAADILIVATPIWMGQPSSVAKRVVERMDAIFGDIGKDGRYPTFDKVGVVAVVGNEDGAHHVTAELYQALADVGYSIPGGSSAYWVGEAMSDTDYQDLAETPKKVADTITTLASNAAHLAKVLKANSYPAPLKGN